LQDANLVDPVVPVARKLGIPVIVTIRDIQFVPSFGVRNEKAGLMHPSIWSRGKEFMGLCSSRQPLSWVLPLSLPFLYAKAPRLRQMLRQATLLLPVSKYVLGELKRYDVNAPAAVLELEPLPEWSLLPMRENEAPTFLSVGRLVEGKGIDVLIRSFANVLHALPEARLLIAGDGPKRPKLQRLANSVLPKDSFRFLGRVAHSDLPEIFAQADIVVVPSNFPETTGRVALEAAMLGRPVIAAASGGLIEAVGNNRGILVKPGDVDELAKAMVELATDPDRQLRIVHDANRYAKRFTAKILKQRLMDVYSEVLSPSDKYVGSSESA
jgi:glycosyltransferase involved in cell wall biosynthesis